MDYLLDTLQLVIGHDQRGEPGEVGEHEGGQDRDPVVAEVQPGELGEVLQPAGLHRADQVHVQVELGRLGRDAGGHLGELGVAAPDDGAGTGALGRAVPRPQAAALVPVWGQTVITLDRLPGITVQSTLTGAAELVSGETVDRLVLQRCRLDAARPASSESALPQPVSEPGHVAVAVKRVRDEVEGSEAGQGVKSAWGDAADDVAIEREAECLSCQS